MDPLGLNTLNQLGPATPSRADATPERSPADPRAPRFGDVLAARGAKPAAKAFGRNEQVTDQEPTEATPPEASPAPVVARFNVVSEKLNEPARPVVAPTADETEDAWGDFLGRMNDDLGVSAEDVLAAFESLSDEDLARKPEATTDQMVAALGLTGQPAALAKTYFKDLIQRTEPPAPDAPREPVPVATTSPRALERALERMGQHLMMNAPAVRAPSVPGARTESLPPPSAGADDAPDATDQTSAQAKAPAAATDARAMNALVDQLKPATDQKLEPKVDRLVREMVEARPAAPSEAPTSDARPTESPLLKPDVTPFAFNAATEASAGTSDDVAAPARDVAPASVKDTLTNSIFASARRSHDEAADSDKDSDDLGEDLTSRFETGPVTGTSSAAKSDFAKELGATAPAAGPSLAPEIVDQARVMVRDGGGEMRVTLNAEGLGEVAMKVHVKDGKVSVEMLTESQEAKRLLEHQLGELKSQLISSNLQIDKLHVDTGSNLSRQNEQNSDAQRQAAREQSFAQFNQQTGGQPQQHARRQAYEAAASRGYGSFPGATRPGAVPAPIAAARANNSRRLNLVA